MSEKKEIRVLGGGAPSTVSTGNPCDSCDVRHKGFFCSSSVSTLTALDQSKSFRHYKTGDFVFRAGEEPEGIYCIRAGAVKIESLGDNGQAHLLHMVNAGGVLGLRASLDGESFQASVIALQPTDICFIPKGTFSHLLKADPTIALNALKAVTFELHEMERRFCHTTDLTASERIAEALLHLKGRFEKQQWSRREFAEYASTTTETVIRTLAQFEKEGLISLEGRKVIIQNRRGLLEKARIFV